MVQYRIEHEFETDADSYWSVFFSDEFNAELWPALDIHRQQIRFERSGEGPDETIYRVHRLVPQRKVPALLARFVEGSIAYEERNRWSRAESRMEVEIVPNFLADKIRSGGTYSVQNLGPSRCRRIWDAYCECSIPLVGSRIAQHIVDEVRQSYERTTAFSREWIATHRPPSTGGAN